MVVVLLRERGDVDPVGTAIRPCVQLVVDGLLLILLRKILIGGQCEGRAEEGRLVAEGGFRSGVSREQGAEEPTP